VLVDSDADRVNSYNIWNYAEGHDSYYSAMLVDLTLPPDKVSSFVVVHQASLRIETGKCNRTKTTRNRKQRERGIAISTGYVETSMT